MLRAARFWSVLACLITGAALCVTRGVLDAGFVNGVGVRVAFLPPWESLVGFLLLAAVVLVLVDWLNRPRTTTAARSPLGWLVLPLTALAVLLLPFTPILPDRWPVIQALAGPMGYVVWLVVLALLAWVWWQHRLVSVAWLSRRSLSELAVMIGLATAVVSGGAALRLTGTVLFPAGDEPHYLVIAQSLWRDGDFKIENNHQRGDYREYFPRELDPHYLTRGADGEIYSIHPVGLPIALAPVYAAGGYPAVLLALIAMASMAAALSWRWVVEVLNAPGAATFAWAAIACSAPFLFNTFTVYPEIAAALAVMVAMTTTNPLVAGVACGVLPWLSTKYAPMSAVLLVTGPDIFKWGWPPLPALLTRAVPYGALLLAWFAFFYVIWGSPMPQAPYGAMVQTTPRNLVFGAPGLLFDQEFGLLPYAPVYILAATGLLVLWRSGGERRMLAVRVALVFAALLGTVGAFRIWWGGSAAPARPLASGLLVLALPIAAAFAAAPQGSARRAAHHLLLWVGVGVALTLTFAQQGLLIANGRDGTSSLLEWWSPRWELWTLAPSFVHHEAPTAAAHAAAWLLLAGVAAVALGRVRAGKPGTAALTAFSVFAMALAAASVIVPRLPDDPPMPRARLDGRSRLPALDTFDTRALPAAVIFDPLRKGSASEVLPALSLSVRPGVRPDPQPVRVLLNGRFSLPAGDYGIDVRLDPSAQREETLSLQFGRVGSPVQSWTIPAATASFQTTFHLPLDASFIGFRGSRELEKALQALTITPLAVVNDGERVHAPTVLGAARYGHLMVMFHDDQVTPEPTGFWVLGKRLTAMSVGTANGIAAPMVLRLRSGVSDNRITVRTRGWQETITLAADAAHEVTLPPARHGIVQLTVDASSGFQPVERDPSSHDRRFLGVWVEVAPQ